MKNWANLEATIKSSEYGEWAYDYLSVLNTINHIRAGLFKCSDERIKALEFQFEFLQLEADDYFQ
jgi:hypothetical protein